MGFSTRCLGTVDDDGYVNDLNLRAIDCVGEPSIGSFCESNGNRFVNGILESKSWVCDNHGSFIERSYDKFAKTLSKMPNTNISSKKADFLGKAVTSFFAEIAGN